MGRDVISYWRSNLKLQMVSDIMISKHFNRSLLSALLQIDPEVIKEMRRLKEKALGMNLNVMFARNRANISNNLENETVDNGRKNTLHIEEEEEQMTTGIAETENNARENVFLNCVTAEQERGRNSKSLFKKGSENRECQYVVVRQCTHSLGSSS